MPRLRADAALARVRIETASPERLPRLTEAASLLGARRLGETPSVSFKIVQEKGSAALAVPLPAGVTSIAIAACQHDPGDDTRREVRGADVKKWLDAHARARGGYLTRLTLRVGVLRAPHPVDVVMELPNKIAFSDVRYETEARAAADAIGLFSPGALPDDARTLMPLTHPDWRFREVFGAAAVERMMANGVLRRVKTTRVAAAAYRPLGRSFTTHAIPGETKVRYALSADLGVGARDVAISELRMLTVKKTALARMMREALRMTPVELDARVRGVIDLGVLATKHGRVRAFYALAHPPKDLLARIRRACRVGTTPVLFVPRGRTLVALGGILQIELAVAEQLGGAPLDGAFARMIEELALEDEIEVTPGAALKAPELVVEKKSRALRLLGVALDAVADSGFELLLFLAENAHRVVHNRELGSATSKATLNPDVVVRKVRSRLGAWIRASFRAARRDVPEGLLERLIEKVGKGGYRLGVTSVVLP